MQVRDPGKIDINLFDRDVNIIAGQSELGRRKINKKDSH